MPNKDDIENLVRSLLNFDAARRATALSALESMEEDWRSHRSVADLRLTCESMLRSSSEREQTLGREILYRLKTAAERLEADKQAELDREQARLKWVEEEKRRREEWDKKFTCPACGGKNIGSWDDDWGGTTLYCRDCEKKRPEWMKKKFRELRTWKL